MSSSGTDGYTWDARNQLVSTLSGASFQYDALARRVSATIGPATTKYLYDGTNILQEIQGATPSANLLLGLSADEVFARTDAAGTADFLTDALGSTIALADPSGTILTQYSYEPFGNTTRSGLPNGNPYQYTGRENDGTGLYYYRARYYSPSFQRFISEDPIGFRGGMNFFAYAGNSPLNLTDPSGLLQVCCRPSMVSRACHCFLKLPNGLGGYNTYGGYNDGLPFNDPTGPLNPRKNDPTDKNASNADCRDVPTSKCQEDKIPPQFPPNGDPASQLPQNLWYGIPLTAGGRGEESPIQVIRSPVRP